MALRECPNCKEKISEYASKCPKCGWDFTSKLDDGISVNTEGKRSDLTKENKKNNKLLFISIAALIVLVVVGVVFFGKGNEDIVNEEIPQYDGPSYVYIDYDPNVLPDKVTFSSDGTKKYTQKGKGAHLLTEYKIASLNILLNEVKNDTGYGIYFIDLENLYQGDIEDYLKEKTLEMSNNEPYIYIAYFKEKTDSMIGYGCENIPLDETTMKNYWNLFSSSVQNASYSEQYDSIIEFINNIRNALIGIGGVIDNSNDDKSEKEGEEDIINVRDLSFEPYAIANCFTKVAVTDEKIVNLLDEYGFIYDDSGYEEDGRNGLIHVDAYMVENPILLKIDSAKIFSDKSIELKITATNTLKKKCNFIFKTGTEQLGYDDYVSSSITINPGDAVDLSIELRPNSNWDPWYGFYREDMAMDPYITICFGSEELEFSNYYAGSTSKAPSHVAISGICNE